MMRLGLIAGNGRFPFLVLEAARAAGHDVTVVAAKEETFPELTEAAKRVGQRDSLGLARPARHLHQPAQEGRRLARRHGRPGQAHQDLFLGHHAGLDDGEGPGQAAVAEYRRRHRRGRRRAARKRHRADGLHRAAHAAARVPRRADEPRADRGRAEGPRVRLPDGGPDRRARHRPDRRRQAPGRRGGRGDGGHRRGDRPRGASRRTGRLHHQGRQAEAGHAVRRAGHRVRDDSGHARRRRRRAVDRRREDPRPRPRGRAGLGQRSEDCDRGATALPGHRA